MGYTPPMLNVRHILAGADGIFGVPGSVTTDDLYIRANSVDNVPYIGIMGATQIILASGSTFGVLFYDNTTSALQINRVTTDTKITSIIDGNDLNLLTTGAGVLKFGTYTAGAATDSTGYITIKDAAGNTRKLMVQA